MPFSEHEILRNQPIFTLARIYDKLKLHHQASLKHIVLWHQIEYWIELVDNDLSCKEQCVEFSIDLLSVELVVVLSKLV